eukprot:COSAG02_NODE_3254_length_7085_cov_102.140281_7_plen_859_part_00
MSLPALVSVGDGTFRAHVVDHRTVEPMPSPRSARERDAARSTQRTAPRGSYAPPARGTRALYVRTPRKVTQDRGPEPTQPAPGPRQPPVPPVSRPTSPRVITPGAASPAPSRTPPWWWPQNLDASDEGLPRSLASMLASQMVSVAAGASELGPTPALPPEARLRALNVAETPLQLVSAAVRTHAPPESPPPSWAQIEVPLVGGQWRGDPIALSMVRTQEMYRAGNEKVFESADALVLESDVHEGPMVQLSPHGCKFSAEPVRMSFAIDQLVEGHQGDAFVVVLRKRPAVAQWVPLEENERLTVSPSGVAVVELREFSWVKAWCFHSENQDNDVANLIKTVFAAGLGDKDGMGATSQNQTGRSKHEGKAANQLGYVGIAPGTSGYLIPGVAAIGVTVTDGMLTVQNNPQLAQRTAKEFSADSPLKLLSASFGGYCYPPPPSDGAAEEKMQIAFLGNAVPDGQEYSELVGKELETVPESEQQLERESPRGQSDVEEVGFQTGGSGEIQAGPAQPDEAALVALFVSAARRGDSAEVKRLLALGIGVNSTDDEGCSALIAASGGDQPVVVSQLLEAGAGGAVDLVNMHGETALMMAAQRGSVGATGLLLKAGAKVDMIDHDGQSAVLIAARMGHAAIVSQLVDSDAELNADFGEMPLHVAAENNHVDVVRLLLQGGADVDKADSYGNTALMNAAVAGYAEVVTELLSQGAVADLEGSGGQTALMKAAKVNTGECVTALVNGKASLDTGDDNGNTALMLAASKGHTQLVQKLLDTGASTVRRNDAGQSAMDVAQEFAEEQQRQGDGSNQSDASDVIAVLEAWERKDEAEPNPDPEPELEPAAAQAFAKDETEPEEIVPQTVQS